jgi:ribosome-associated toxin RatA of RatAB toxin-antitoxin module
MNAPREEIFALVRDLSRWPKLLPHYRRIDFLRKDGPRDIVRMAATRSGIPITWVSAFEADETLLELRFEHLRMWTRGMQVVWTFTPTRDGTRVEIVHDLIFRVRPLRWIAEPIIGRFFIENIAGKTLQTFKQIVEKGGPEKTS